MHRDSKVKSDLVLVYFYFRGNIFQKRRVSSPAPVTMVVPSGFMARYRTLKVCPVKVSIFSICGILHTLISLREYPWVLTSSLTVLANIKLQTWDPASMHLVSSPVIEFQNRIVRSAVPPPDTSSPCW